MRLTIQQTEALAVAARNTALRKAGFWYSHSMSTITAILEPDADGTLHLSLPKNLWHGKVRVVATLLDGEPGDDPLTSSEDAALSSALEQLRTRAGLRRRELPLAEQERRRQAALEALRQLRESNPYVDLSDPVAWQREQRQDRGLPFRD
jgi:hypothetical protein